MEAFIADILSKWKPATAHNRYRSLHTFFKWLAEEGEIEDSPMARMNCSCAFPLAASAARIFT